MLPLSPTIATRRSTHLLTRAALALLVGTCSGHAQQPTPPCTLEVASIRPTDAHTSTHIFIEPGDAVLHAYTFSASELIRLAYGLKDLQQVVGHPAWATTERFDVVARVSEDQARTHCLRDPTALEAALQELLQQRFGLAVHPTQRTVSVFSLEVIPGKLKLQAATPPAEFLQRSPDGFIVLYPPLTITGEYTTTAHLADLLSTPVNRYVLDHTGLTGRYSFKLEYSAADQDTPSTEAAPDRPSIFVALRQQLGLKLVPEKHLMPAIVVDHLDRPSPN